MTTGALILKLDIPADEFLRLYSGSARDVIAVAESGESVRFPGNILRGHVLHDGVRGRFRITFDSKGKFQSIERLPH